MQDVTSAAALYDEIILDDSSPAVTERLQCPDLFHYISNRESLSDEHEAHLLFTQLLHIAIECQQCGVVH